MIHCGVSHRTNRMAISSCQLVLTGAVSCGILSTTSPSGQSNCIISYVCPYLFLFRIFEKSLQCCDIHPVEHVAIIGTTTGEWQAIELGESNQTLNKLTPLFRDWQRHEQGSRWTWRSNCLGQVLARWEIFGSWVARQQRLLISVSLLSLNYNHL